MRLRLLIKEHLFESVCDHPDLGLRFLIVEHLLFSHTDDLLEIEPSSLGRVQLIRHSQLRVGEL